MNLKLLSQTLDVLLAISTLCPTSAGKPLESVAAQYVHELMMPCGVFFITWRTLPRDELVCIHSRNVWFVVLKKIKNVGHAIQPRSSRVEDTSLDIRDRKTSVIKFIISTTPRV